MNRKSAMFLTFSGIFCCLVSNQSGPARGYNPVSHLEALHKRLCLLLEQEAGARLDAVYYCPYLSESEGGTNAEFTRYTKPLHLFKNSIV